MADFSPVVRDFWLPRPVDGDVIHEDEEFTIIVDPHLAEDRRVTILTTADGPVTARFTARVTARVTPDMADVLDLPSRPDLTESTFRQALTEAGVVMHGADCLFYFTDLDKAALLDESPSTVRRLNEGDAALFAAFESAASEQDLDDAYVELDHWAVFGSFEGDRLAAAASSYPWGEARLADVGVLTLPEFRGKGHGRAVVRALCRHAYGEGYEPQYRCQLDNHASRGLAASAGLTQFGTWEVISSDSTDA